LFGTECNLRGPGDPGLGNPDSSGYFLGPDTPSLPVLVWLVMVLGWLSLLVSLAMVLAFAVLATMALVVLEMASLISISGTIFANLSNVSGDRRGLGIVIKDLRHSVGGLYSSGSKP
jgi:hypothetical protein